jgi:hypothetical protein
MKPKSHNPADRLQSLDALGAIETWLAGDFGYSDENVLIVAIRRHADIDLSDSEIKGVFCEALEDDRKPMDILQRLIRANSGLD